MNKHKPRKSTSIPAQASEIPIANSKLLNHPLRSFLLALLVALFVARPLVPSEGAASIGDGQPFCMLWVLLGVATSLAAIKTGWIPRRWGWIEWALVAFVALHSVASWNAVSLGSPRPILNMLWEGVAMVAGFLLARQLVQTTREARAIVAVMFALAIVFSAFGYYQVFVGMPADRAEYAQNPDEMLRLEGQWFAKGSPERAAFESRLNSTEPLATFALTNSLAGYLASWLIVGIGITLVRPSSSAEKAKWSMRRYLMAILILVPLGCLLLTKSRSAYIAVLVGIICLIAIQLRSLSIAKSKILAGLAIVVVLLLAVGFGLRGFNPELLANAEKSLNYRLQYWKSTATMIADYPLFGVGPGMYQDVYTRYKAADASEEVRDPHNWAFEIAATAGLPALAVLTFAIGVALVRLFRKSELIAFPEPPQSAYFIYVGAFVGFLIAVIVGHLFGMPLGSERFVVGLLLGAPVIFFLNTWVQEGTITPQLLGVASIVLLVNLLAAGGIMIPAVAGSLWLMLALGLNLIQPPAPAASAPSILLKSSPSVGFAAFAVLAIGAYLTGYSPVLRSQGAMSQALAAENDLIAQENALKLAAELDARSADPWQSLAQLKLVEWFEKPGLRAIRQFREACTELLKRRPQSAAAHRLVGNWNMQVYEKSHKIADAESATTLLTRASTLYPNLPVLRADLSNALMTTGKREAAKSEAAKALELDAITPHEDKKLSPEMREKLRALVESR